MEPTTSYTVTGTNTKIVWQFKYYLNGLLAEFKLLEGELDQKQTNWLFKLGHFPYRENEIKGWTSIKNFKIEVGKPDLSFEAFMKLYKNPVKKQAAQKAWDRTSKKNQLKAIEAIKGYDGYLSRKGTAKAMPSTYLNQQYYLDDFNAVH